MVRTSILCCIMSTVICSIVSSSFSQNMLKKQMISYIVPGEGVGELVLGDTVGNVNTKLSDYARSAPRQILENQNRDGCDTTVWVEYPDAGLTMIYCKSTRALIRIVVTTPSLLVRKTNVHVGSGWDELSKSYLSECRVQEDTSSGVKWREYPSEGISFLIDEKMGAISAIDIFRPLLKEQQP